MYKGSMYPYTYRGITRIHRTSTGISKLDELLHGGFIRGRTYLVAGETGTGKTIFSLQFLIYGATVLNEPGIYVLIDEDYYGFIQGVKTLGWDLDKLWQTRRIAILQPSLDMLDKLKGKHMDAVVESIVQSIESQAYEINARRLVIDPIAPLIIGEKEDIVKVREFIRKLMLAVRNRVGCTTIVTSEIPTGTNALSRYGVEEYLADGVIVLKIVKTRDGYKRVMYIRKMRWTPVQPIELEFEIVSGQGIVIKGVFR